MSTSVLTRKFGLLRYLNSNYLRTFSTGQKALNKEVQVTFLKANGDKLTAKGKVGQSLLDVAVSHNLDLEGFGACEACLTCSTCHLIFKQEDFDSFSSPTVEEEDMLDLASELGDTSRLGCQIVLTEQMNQLEVKVPATKNDQRN